MRRILTSLIASALLCGVTSLAQAQTAPSKGAKDAAKPAAAAKPATPATPAAKPAAPGKPEAAAAAAAVAAAGGAEPTLIGQFGTWGAYTASPNGKKVCFALAKPASSKTNPPIARAIRPTPSSPPVRPRRSSTKSRS